MEEKVLEDLGLSKNEVKLYLYLLKGGQLTTTPIIKDTGLPTSKVYESLDRLLNKGLVSYCIKSNHKHFSAADPAVLRELLKEKELLLKDQSKQLNSVIPSLNSLKCSQKDSIKADIYEGLGGIKTLYERILTSLSKGQTQYIIGAPRIGNELIEGYLLDWHARRIKKRVHCRYIFDSDVRDYGEVRKNMLYTKVRYLPKTIVSPVWIEIFNDTIAIGHIKGRNAILFVIQDREIARGYLDYFNLIWKISRE